MARVPFKGSPTAEGSGDSGDSDSGLTGDSGDGDDGPEPVLSFDLGTGGGKEAKRVCAYSRIDSSVLAEGNEGEAITNSTQKGRRKSKKERTRRYALYTHHILPLFFGYFNYLRLRTRHTNILSSTNRPQQVIRLQRTAH